LHVIFKDDEGMEATWESPLEKYQHNFSLRTSCLSCKCCRPYH
jgi:hypothetical protein